MKSRTKLTLSGKHLEIEMFPVTEHGHRCDRKNKLSLEAQRKQNEKNAAKRMERLVNSNFVKNDLLLTLNYRAELRPDLDYSAVLRDTQNYLRRVKAYRKRNGLPYIKYIYVVEKTGHNNWHVHMIMSQMSRDAAESLWHYADYVNCDRFQPTTQEGGAAFANYIAGKKGGKNSEKPGRNWNCSKNLVQPTETHEDGTHTRRELARFARERVDDKEYWEHKYKGYRFVSAYPTYNEYNGWWYLYVRMYRIEEYTAVKRGDHIVQRGDRITNPKRKNRALQ